MKKSNIEIFNSKNFQKILIYLILPIIIFSFAYFLRIYFFSGFILCDDAEELSLLLYLMDNPPDFVVPLHVRFGLWVFNLISFKLLGISELSFFLPTLIISSTISVIGYFILYLKKYKLSHCFLSGLFIASVPFEILIGTLRANDLIFSWILALSILVFFVFEKKQLIQGIILGFLLWFAFYIKMWVVYVFPLLFVYYLLKILHKKDWKGMIGFSVSSFFLHLITCLYWKVKTGEFLPFITKHSATYPVPGDYLIKLLGTYPKYIFSGTEFGTTLFGYIPYLLIMLVFAKTIFTFLLKKKISKKIKLDKFDYFLIIYYCTWFILLEFFPNSFKFDQYYSAPRIFRYLTPLSFPMTLHLVKLLSDFSGIFKKVNLKINPKILTVFLFFGLILFNFFQTTQATEPGRIYRENLLTIVDDIREQNPPQIISESWLGFFLRSIYLKDTEIEVVPIYQTYAAKDYEKWLKENQDIIQPGSMLISGMGSCVYYGAYYDGFRLNQFDESLGQAWKLYKEYGSLDYLPYPEMVKLWIFAEK